MRCRQRLSLVGNRSVRGSWDRRPQRKPVSSHTIPLLNQKPVGLQEGANLRALPARNFLQNRHENDYRIVTEDRSASDMGYMLSLRNRDGESFPCIDMQHYVDIGVSIAGVNNMVRSDLEIRLKLIEYGDFSVTGASAQNRINLSRVFVLEFRSVNPIGRNDSFQR